MIDVEGIDNKLRSVRADTFCPHRYPSPSLWSTYCPFYSFRSVILCPFVRTIPQCLQPRLLQSLWCLYPHRTQEHERLQLSYLLLNLVGLCPASFHYAIGRSLYRLHCSPILSIYFTYVLLLLIPLRTSSHFRARNVLYLLHIFPVVNCHCTTMFVQLSPMAGKMPCSITTLQKITQS